MTSRPDPDLRPPFRPGLPDGQGRRVRYLRLAVTDRCNLRCTYCVPPGGIPFLDRRDLLKRSELVFLAEAAVRLGLVKIRLTGGEPTLRPDLVEIASDLAHVPGLQRLAMTSNGLLLERLAGPLADAGLQAVNVSLDSLQPDRYRRITRGGDLAACRRGIDAARAAGLAVQLNVVLLRGVNEPEIPDFVALAAAEGLTVRFIETMPTVGGEAAPRLVPGAEVLDSIAVDTALIPVATDDLAGPAAVWRIAGSEGRIGLISAVTCGFCEDCNRIRVTPTGTARGCLFREQGVDLRPWLSAGDRPGLETALRRAVREKPGRHGLSDPDDGPDQVLMSRLGG